MVKRIDVMTQIIASTYEIIEQIGSGGGGVVYLANHLRLAKKVILKADKRPLTINLAALRREVDVLKDLSHSYIPQVYDFFIKDGTVFTVMDYIEGESFDKFLKRGEEVSQIQVIKWACELLEALCYLHSPTHGTPPHGIIHSDIKPSNIMLTPHGSICLIDFNIAFALGETHAIGRSAGYASPEHYGLDFSTDDTSNDNSLNDDASADNNTNDDILSDDYPTALMDEQSPDSENSNQMSALKAPRRKTIIPDVRSDIYSLGATLYHLLTGIRPSKDAKKVPPISDPKISPIVSAIIAKSMNPNPELRYQTASEMLFDFKHLREKDPRSQKLKQKIRLVRIVLAVLFLAGVLSAFSGLKMMEIAQRSITYAEYAQTALSSGDPSLAITYALEALPDKNSFLKPPHIEQAQKQLTDALGVYDLSDVYKPLHVKKLPSAPLKIALSPDGKTGAAVYAFCVDVFDMQTGDSITTLPTIHSALADVAFLNENTLVFAGEKGLCAYDTKDKTMRWTTSNPATEIALSADGQTVASVLKDANVAYIYNIQNSYTAHSTGESGVSPASPALPASPASPASPALPTSPASSASPDATVPAAMNAPHSTVVPFGDEKKQRVASNSTFVNPNDNILALNWNGNLLASSFDNGGLTIFDIAHPDNNIEIFDTSDFFRFEGGFYGQYFAFSATGSDKSVFAVIDTESQTQTGGFESPNHFGVIANESGILISSENLLVKINPITGEQQEIAYTDSDIYTFSSDTQNAIVSTVKNHYLFFDHNTKQLGQYNNVHFKMDFVAIARDFAIAASRNTPEVRILKKNANDKTPAFYYDASDLHDEARISVDEKRIMLYDYMGFRLYDGATGQLLQSVSIPNSNLVYDQQYSKNSGNLAVLYEDTFRLYSGIDGSLLVEETDLKSVFYAPYGVSILKQDGMMNIIHIDSAQVIMSKFVEGNFAAFCGLIVDDTFLGNRKLIGATQIDDKPVSTASNNMTQLGASQNDSRQKALENHAYIFAVNGKDSCVIYNDTGEQLFEVPSAEQSEAFFTDNALIISPLHGTPVAYRLKNGEKITELEKDAYLTYITQISSNIISEYISSDGKRFGLLLDGKTYKAIASLPYLTDITNQELIFDYHMGTLRKTRIYSIEELIDHAKQAATIPK